MLLFPLCFPAPLKRGQSQEKTQPINKGEHKKKQKERRNFAFVAGLAVDGADNGRGNVAFAEQRNGTLGPLEE